MTKLAPEWVQTSDPVIRSPSRYRWTTAPASLSHRGWLIDKEETAFGDLVQRAYDRYDDMYQEKSHIYMNMRTD